MNQNRGPQAGPDVRRTAGEKTELVMEGVGQPASQRLVQFRHLLPGGLELHAVVEGLDAEVVFFVDHHSARPARAERERRSVRRRPFVRTDQLPAHHVAFVQDPPFDGLQLGHLPQHAVVQIGARSQRVSYLIQDAAPIIGIGSKSEGVPLEVAGQTHAGRKHDLVILAASIQPRRSSIVHRGRGNAHAVAAAHRSAASSTLIWSRSSAAASKSSSSTALSRRSLRLRSLA